MSPGELSSHQETVSVLVAESTRIHGELLAQALNRNSRITVLAAVYSSQEFEAVVSRALPDVIVLSGTFDEDSTRGFTLLREFHRAHPTIPVVMLLDCCKKESVLEAFRSGAKGVFSRNESSETLSKCVISVYEGQVWANSREFRYALEALYATPTVRALDARGVELLSRREVELVEFLAQGLTNREIGKRMRLSPHTVKNYLLRIFDKLGVSNRVELLSLTLSSPVAQPRPRREVAENPPMLWCYHAAQQGAPYAQFQLAELYKDGKGTPQDPALAYMWYCIAEQMAEPVRDQIRHAKSELAGRLRPEQLQSAQFEAEQWLMRNGPSARRRTQESVAPKLHPSAESSGRMAFGD